MIHSCKIVKTVTADGKNKNVASISKKNVLTGKNPGAVLVCGYDAKKKPICCCIVEVFALKVKDGMITKNLSDASLFDYLTIYTPEGENLGEDISYMAPDFLYKSSNSKVLSVDANGKITTKKNGTVTITLKNAVETGTYDAERYRVAGCNIKLKLKVKVPSVKGAVKITPGKTKTITVKGVCSQNQIKSVTADSVGNYFAVTGQSGKMKEKIKVKASPDGGCGTLTIEMESQTLYVTLYSEQTKKRLYTDVGKTGSYDTKTAKALVKKINAERKKNGLSALTQYGPLTVMAELAARGSQEDMKKQFDTKQAILAELPDGILDPLDETIGVAIFYDTQAGKYYLTVLIV